MSRAKKNTPPPRFPEFRAAFLELMGDSIFCDRKPGPAHYVVGVWAHICVELQSGMLFNAADNQKAPPEAYRAGRVLYVKRPLVNEAEA